MTILHLSFNLQRRPALGCCFGVDACSGSQSRFVCVQSWLDHRSIVIWASSVASAIAPTAQFYTFVFCSTIELGNLWRLPSSSRDRHCLYTTHKHHLFRCLWSCARCQSIPGLSNTAYFKLFLVPFMTELEIRSCLPSRLARSYSRPLAVF